MVSWTGMVRGLCSGKAERFVSNKPSMGARFAHPRALMIEAARRSGAPNGRGNRVGPTKGGRSCTNWSGEYGLCMYVLGEYTRGPSVAVTARAEAARNLRSCGFV